MNVQTNNQKGFTIIEVVLVLAIAGLIFLMVFIALPALQRSQRDTQRRDDAAKLISQLNSYSTNNKGAIPTNQTALKDFATSYLKWAADGSGEFNDPTTGVGYVLDYGTGTPTTDGHILYLNGGNCSNESIVTGGSARQAAIAIKLEGSGVFCTTSK
ncbi:MAG TPA: type II secretion system protein [Candidatus Saccharimonadales bacterium]|nr:type II secretion system protein [Candidatus Saccharimonadales bacterium]